MEQGLLQVQASRALGLFWGHLSWPVPQAPWAGSEAALEAVFSTALFYPCPRVAHRPLVQTLGGSELVTEGETTK